MIFCSSASGYILTSSSLPHSNLEGQLGRAALRIRKQKERENGNTSSLPQQ
jgi:hypothetical protein